MAALSLNGGTGRAVLYQSVTNTENGSDKGSVDANAMSVKQVADATANSVLKFRQNLFLQIHFSHKLLHQEQVVV